MYPFENILVPTDYSLCAESAQQAALHLARRFRAAVHVLHVEQVREPVSASNDDTAVATPAPSAGVSLVHDVTVYRSRRRAEDVAGAILAHAEEVCADLIVMGAHGDDGADRFLSRGGHLGLLGATTGQVVRHATCSVLSVVQRGLEHVRDILVPFDHAPLSHMALTVAEDVADMFGARVLLLQVLDSRRPYDDGDGTESKIRRDLIEAFKKTERPEVPASFHVRHGNVAREIRSFARQHAVDLVVLGAHSNPGHLLLGDVAAHVVSTASTSVLVVREATTSRAQSANGVIVPEEK